MNPEIRFALFKSIHEILGQPENTLALDRGTRLEEIGINSLAFIRICMDLERTIGVDLTEAEDLTKPETIGDIFDLVAGLRRA